MAAYTIQIFGRFKLTGENGRLINLPQKPKKLLAIIALNPREFVPRLTIAEKLWPDTSEQEAKALLSKLSWRLRRLLEENFPAARGAVFQSQDDAMAFDLDRNFTIDADPLYKAFDQINTITAIDIDAKIASDIENGLAFYAGDFLEDVFLDDDWCQQLRESYRVVHQYGLEIIFQYHRQQKNWFKAIKIGTQLIIADPLLEHVHRDLIYCHMELGNRALAVKQYQKCELVLQTELDVAPMPETRQAYLSTQQPMCSISGVSGAMTASKITGYDRKRSLAEQVGAAMTDLEDIKSLMQTLVKQNVAL